MELKVKDKSKCFDEIYWFLCEQYRKANPLRFILLVGVDDELPYDIANYILGHRYQNGYLRCIDYPSETDIVEHISQMRFGTVLLLRGLEKASQVALIPIIRKIESVIYDHNEKPKPLVIEGKAVPCDEFGTLIINTSNPNIIPEHIKEYFEVISIEPETPASTPEKQTPASTPKENSCVLDNANYLHIDGEPVKLSPVCADLLRFITRELKDNDFLELQYILAYHYGDIEAMSKMTLSKNERQPFEKEKYKINSLCKKILKKDLIKCLGDKKYTLSINIKLPKNSPKDSP